VISLPPRRILWFLAPSTLEHFLSLITGGQSPGYAFYMRRVVRCGTK